MKQINRRKLINVKWISYDIKQIHTVTITICKKKNAFYNQIKLVFNYIRITFPAGIFPIYFKYQQPQ